LTATLWKSGDLPLTKLVIERSPVLVAMLPPKPFLIKPIYLTLAQHVPGAVDNGDAVKRLCEGKSSCQSGANQTK
jgi:hypothetical protein